MTVSKKSEVIGGKAQNLIGLVDYGYRVLSFVIISNSELNNSIGKLDIEGLVEGNFTLPREKRYAVRSSANIEDGLDHSFAGLFLTELNVGFDGLYDAVQSVYNSTQSDEVNTYLTVMKIDRKVEMSVIIQEMVDADVSGVGFSRHPLLADGSMLVNSVFGLGEALVSGVADADQYLIKNAEIITTINSGKSSLTDSMVRDVSDALIDLKAQYGHDVDIEFAYKNEELYLLQVRPITTANNIEIGSTEGSKIIWDNSNIIESYPGVTSPLTFSFINKMYEVVYKQFSEILGTDIKVIEENEAVYANMLGHLNGRVYYNLRSWYVALAMVPGYKINAPFMEKMMGVKESFELEKEIKIGTSRAWWQTLKSINNLVKSLFGLKKQSKQFMKFSNGVIFDFKTMDYSAMTINEVADAYHSFEDVLSKEWKAPLVNDFFAMIYFGILSKWAEKIVPDNKQCINDLLIGSHDIVSVDPMKLTIRIAQKINNNEAYSKLFDQSAKSILKELNSPEYSELTNDINNYISEFGDRYPEELKLETRTYTQNPEEYIDLLKTYMNIDLDRFSNSNQSEARNEAERVCMSALGGNIIKKKIFKRILNKTRYLISNRENLRFQRTKGYGVVRIIFDELGEKLSQAKAINAPSDIYYLKKEEIFQFINGTSSDTNLKRMIDGRKTDEAAYATHPMKDRITTYGAVNSNELIDSEVSIGQSDITGIGCCPGIINAKATVVTDPKIINDLDNTILVAKFTDPGWVRLFPSAAAIIVEKGSLLSHSAIVARELGIPCIVSASGIMESVVTGDTIILNGSTGEIKINKQS